jgi:hypothetical protein
MPMTLRDRDIGQPPSIPAVHPVRGLPTWWALRLAIAQACLDQQAVTTVGDHFDQHRTQMRQQNVKITFE